MPSDSSANADTSQNSAPRSEDTETAPLSTLEALNLALTMNNKPRKRTLDSPRLSAAQAAEMFARRLELNPQERAFYIAVSPVEPRPPDIIRLFLLRRLDQRCPDCSQHEAAHYYCSRCLLPMNQADWYDRRSGKLAPMSERYAKLLSAHEVPAGRRVK
jgi:hypothetical protein